MAPTVSAALAVALLLLLATPLDVHVAVERDRAVATRARVSWLFGLVRLDLRPRAGADRPRRASPPPARRTSARGARLRRRLARRLLRPDLRARSAAFLRGVLRALRPREVRVRARIGFDDPADTGRLWAALGPLVALLASRDVRLEPAFDEPCLRFRAAGRVRLIPAQLLFLTATFLLSPPVVRALLAR